MARMCVLEAQKFSINIFIARQNLRRERFLFYWRGEEEKMSTTRNPISDAVNVFSIYHLVDAGWQSFLATVMFPSQELNYHLACLVCHRSLSRQTQRTENSFFFSCQHTEFAIFMTRLDWVECKQRAPSGQWFRSPISGLEKIRDF